MSSDNVRLDAAQRATATLSAGARAKEPAAERNKAQLQPAAALAPAPVAEDAVKAVAQRIESYLKSVSRSLEFRVDAESGHTVVSVRDSETGDLIRQIPNEEVLRFAEMAEDQTIVLIKESA
jgi:flagellar protein FlaG